MAKETALPTCAWWKEAVQVLALHGDHDLLLAPYNVSLRVYEELGIEMVFPTLIKYI